jgi:hypothetical protein
MAVGQFGGTESRSKFEAGGEGGIVQCALQYGVPFPIPTRGDPVRRFEELRSLPKDGADLVAPPDVESALLPFRIGIQAGVETAIRVVISRAMKSQVSMTICLKKDSAVTARRADKPA